MKIGALRKRGIPNKDRAASFFLSKFRRGQFGRWTLDDMSHLPKQNALALNGATLDASHLISSAEPSLEQILPPKSPLGISAPAETGTDIISPNRHGLELVALPAGELSNRVSLHLDTYLSRQRERHLSTSTMEKKLLKSNRPIPTVGSGTALRTYRRALRYGQSDARDKEEMAHQLRRRAWRLSAAVRKEL